MHTGRCEACIQSGDAVLVHCGGGKGRAGTVLACWMVKHGLGQYQAPHHPDPTPALGAGEAVAMLRRLRPGSIETHQQEAFVGEYSRQLWHRCNCRMVEQVGGCGVGGRGCLVGQLLQRLVLGTQHSVFVAESVCV